MFRLTPAAQTERINGIIKDEYLDCYPIKNIMEAKELLKQIVQLYNDERPHMSIGNMKPSQVHQTNQKTNILLKYKNPINVKYRTIELLSTGLSFVGFFLHDSIFFINQRHF